MFLERRSPAGLRRSFQVCLWAMGLVLGCQTPPHPVEGDSPLFADVAEEVGLDFVHFNGMSGELHIVEMMGPGVALLDYDGDGDLDVYLRQGEPLAPQAGRGVSSSVPDRAARGDRLYRNDPLRAGSEAALRLLDVAAAAGIGPLGYGMGVATGDIDNDGLLDLYLTNFGSNRLLRNRGDGAFEDVTAVSGTDDPRWSVPALFADLDLDGWLDLYVGSYADFDLAHPQHCQRRDSLPDYCGPRSYRPLPARLFRNRGDGRFEDRTAAAGLAGHAGYALGAVAFDADQDGWPDLYVANDSQENFLWRGQGDGTFREEALLRGCAVNAAGLAEASMGIAPGDFDADGDEDLLLTHLTGETNTLYANHGGEFRDSSLASGLGPPSLPWTGFGTVWIDGDGDGWQDLVTVNGAVRVLDEQARAGDPLPLRQPKQWFQNLGDGTFREEGARSGTAFTDLRVGRGAASGDLDNDGDADLVVTNNHGPAELLRNGAAQDRPWLGVRLVSAHGGRDALGARLELHRVAAPPLVRWARTEGSYASASDPRILAALGPATEVERLRVRWPGGRMQEFLPGRRNVYVTLYESEGRSAAPAAPATP